MIFKLSVAALTGKYDKKDFSHLTKEDWESLYEMAVEQSIAALTYKVAREYIVTFEELNKKWELISQQALVKELSFDAERSIILQKMEEAKIKYLPLKGIIINKMYPQPGLRQFADNDILYAGADPKELEKIMHELGYKTILLSEYSNHDIYEKEPIYSFEMHKQLLPKKSSYHEYFLSAWDRAIRDENTKFGYHMSKEDFYVYFMAHMHKHYDINGTGIRSINDLYLIQKSMTDVDTDYIKEQLEIIGIKEFCKEMKDVCAYLFEGGELTERVRENMKYIASSATYGTKNHFVENRMKKSKNMFVYTLHRIFPPLKEVRTYFPIVGKWPILLPFAWIYRYIRLIFVKERRESFVMEIKKLKNKLLKK
ncbi:MAG: hypothetical protein E7252_09900 [Lachnospira sp.]|nr:hypothetical protein [Lachnospira sp.]